MLPGRVVGAGALGMQPGHGMEEALIVVGLAGGLIYGGACLGGYALRYLALVEWWVVGMLWVRVGGEGSRSEVMGGWLLTGLIVDGG
ncbi:hypothetical protein P152DRAFT_475976 [Eremomyces bilateralis CBS 781.70]|uniref:Uncharacterized protein n=1 Tax=Eremomyces bilateralis CBS 781.70 TaxID=1392243 RepID=A0A6G1FWM6_9PEZI|nr:uncharacterized protein P152DRAFT_475976 [Eremomyces bilateralis CBS 781.70]KAF1810138.1 hypothetical protein P152DRAFT_475976 [Eremomyces bilateralis CBS 781.70]